MRRLWWLWLVLAGPLGCGPPSELTSIGTQVQPPLLRPSPEPDGGAALPPWPTSSDAAVAPALPWPLVDGQPHPLGRAPLPAPWPPEHFAIAGVQFGRWVVGDDQVVGLSRWDGAVLAATASGGLFSDRGLGGWRPQRTPLPPLARVHADGELLLACAQNRAPARLSMDAGQSWAHLDFRCGDGASVALSEGRVFRLGHDWLEVWTVATGARRRLPLPISAPVAVGAAGQKVIVFGRDSAYWSDDGGEELFPAEVPEMLPIVKQVLSAQKHVMVAVGKGREDGPSLLLSRDDGRHWAPPGSVPRNALDLWSVAVDANRTMVAAPRTAQGVVIRSGDVGRTWRAVPSPRPMYGATVGRPSGVLVGLRGGLARAVDGPAMRPLSLDQPLRTARFTHPLIGVGIGALSGIYCTADGGVRWTLCSPDLQLPFTVLEKADGHTYFAGGPGVLRRTRDAGQTWNTVTLAVTCAPRWARFFGESGIMACGDERYLITDDAARTWTEALGAPAAMPPPIWLDDRRLVSVDDGRLLVSRDGGWSWAEEAAPRPGLVEVRPYPDGLSVLTTAGDVGTASDLDGPWSWRVAPTPSTLSTPVITHRVLGDGRVLLLDRTRIYLWDGSGDPVGHGPVPGARALALTGDGGLLVLQDAATTRFGGQ